MILDRIIQGNVLDVMKDIPSEIVQTVVTSPPYWGLRDYGVPGQLGLEPTPEAYVGKMVEVFREVRRLLSPDGTLWLNLGDSYNSGAPGSRDADRWPKQERNNHKFRPGSGRADGIVDERAQRNRDGVHAPGLKPKDMCGIPWRVALALQADGWYLRSDIIWSKPNPMPESVTDRPTKAHEYIFLMTKNERYFYDAEAIKERVAFGQEGRVRDDAVGGVSHKERGQHSVGGRYVKRPSVERLGFNGKTNTIPGREAFRAVVERRSKRTVWTVSTKPFAEAHFATFPEELIEPCILAGAPRGGLVFDPFMGAGTVGLVAARFDRRFLGVELNPDYIKIANRRIAPELNQTKLQI